MQRVREWLITARRHDTTRSRVQCNIICSSHRARRRQICSVSTWNQGYQANDCSARKTGASARKGLLIIGRPEASLDLARSGLEKRSRWKTIRSLLFCSLSLKTKSISTDTDSRTQFDIYGSRLQTGPAHFPYVQDPYSAEYAIAH